jgi:hypothetical protein
MSSIADILDNSIINNTLKLFVVLYAGYLYKVDSSRLHPLLKNKAFSFAFIALTIYILSRKFWFSIIITAIFYAIFHFLTQIENKSIQNINIVPNFVKSNNNTLAVPPVYQLPNSKNGNQAKKVHFNHVAQVQEYDAEHEIESNTDENIETENENLAEKNYENNVEHDPGQEITINQANHNISQNIIYNNYQTNSIPDKFKQFIDLQTKSENITSPDIKFIDISLKKENVVPYDKTYTHYVL